MKPPDDLAHFGIKGMKWGVRRGDGSKSAPKKELTPEERSARIKQNAKIAVGAVVAARVLFVVGSMAAGTVLHNRSMQTSAWNALGASNIMHVPLKGGVFKVTSL